VDVVVLELVLPDADGCCRVGLVLPRWRHNYSDSSTSRWL
jgi:hypothetical protein